MSGGNRYDRSDVAPSAQSTRRWAMVSATTGALVFACLVAIAPPRAVRADPMTFEFSGGDTPVEGEIERVPLSNDLVVVRESGSGELRTLYFRDLTPRTVYRVRLTRLAADDAPAHIELGDYCLGVELWAEAERMFLVARQLALETRDRGWELLASAREGRANELFGQAEDHARRSEREEALSVFLDVYQSYSDLEWGRRAHERAEGLFDDLALPPVFPEPAIPQRAAPNDDDQGANAPGNPSPNVDDTEELSSRDRRRQVTLVDGLERGERLLDEADTLMRASIANDEMSGSPDAVTNPGLEAWRSLGDEGAAAWFDAVREKAEPGVDDEIITRVREDVLRRKALVLSLSLHLGHVFARGAGTEARREATRWINRALAIQPSNEEARQLRLLITEQELRARG